MERGMGIGLRDTQNLLLSRPELQSPLFSPQRTTSIITRVCNLSSFLFLRLVRTWSSTFLLWGLSFDFSQPNTHQLLTQRQNSQGLSMFDKVQTLSWRSRIWERPYDSWYNPAFYINTQHVPIEYLRVGTAPNARTARTPSPSWDIARRGRDAFNKNTIDNNLSPLPTTYFMKKPEVLPFPLLLLIRLRQGPRGSALMDKPRNCL